MTTQITAEERALFDVVAEIAGEKLHDLPDQWSLYRWEDLHRHRRAARKTLRHLLDAAKGRDMSDDEQRHFDTLGEHLDDIAE